MKVHKFEIPSTDGYPLRGKIHLPGGEPAPAVLCLHGFKGFMDWGFWPLFTELLASRGLAACRFNISGSGIGPDGETFSDKERFESNTYSRELDDIHRVIDALATGAIPGAATRPGPIGLVGHSRGGGMSVLAAATDPRVASLVTWAAIATVERYSQAAVMAWRERGYVRVENARTGDVFRLRPDIIDDVETNGADLDILAAGRSLDIPTLVAHGSEDEAVPMTEAMALVAALGKRGRFLSLEGAGHTFGAAHPMPEEMPADLERVFEASTSHLLETLRR